MSHITEFEIAGLAGSDRVFSTKLNRDVNIVFGLNGSGKTSLLRILDSAMSGDAGSLANVPFTRASVKIFTVKYNLVFERTVEKPRPTVLTWSEPKKSDDAGLVQTVLPTTSASPLRWVTHPHRKDLQGSFARAYLPTWRLYAQSPSPAAFFPSTGGFTTSSWVTDAEPPSTAELQLDRQFAAHLTYLWSNYSASVLAEVRKAQENGLADILKAILSSSRKGKTKKRASIPADAAYARVASFLQRQGPARFLGSPEAFHRRYRRDSSLRTVASEIDTLEQLTDQAMAPRLQLQRLISALLTGAKTVTFTDTAINVATTSGSMIPLESLSSGEKHLLRILVDILRAAQNTILIDEPELSLHVDWQRHLIGAMKQINPEAQIIMATHSPEIMAEVDESKIFKL